MNFCEDNPLVLPYGHNNKCTYSLLMFPESPRTVPSGCFFLSANCKYSYMCRRPVQSNMNEALKYQIYPSHTQNNADIDEHDCVHR